MTFFSSRREFALWVLVFTYLAHVVAYNWWADFFQNLQERNLSYRFFQIWVQSDSPKRPFVVPIGSSDLDFDKWSRGLERLLYQSLRYPDVPFRYDFITDQKTFYQYNDHFLKWAERYENKVDFIFYPEVIEHTPDFQNYAYDQCENGIAAACSDFLRMIALHDPLFDYNVYMDIDTFIHCRKISKNPLLPHSVLAQKSPDLLGLNKVTPGLTLSTLLNVGQSFSQSSFRLNNDFLVDFQHPQWESDFVRNLGLQRIKSAEPFFHLLSQRPQIDTFEQYQKHLEEKIQYALNHPDKNINQIPLVITSAGPGFWKDLYLRGLASRYFLPIIPSAGVWMNHKGSVYGSACVQDLKLFISNTSDLNHMLALNYLSHDYYYFKPREKEWLPLLVDQMQEHLEQITQEQREIGEKLFQSSFIWIEDIIHG